MGSPQGRDLNDWYATPEQQVFLCFSVLTAKFLKERDGEVSEQKHWRMMKHFFPYLEEYIPEEHQVNLPHRLKERGDKLNRYKREHPIHESRRNTSGRFWEWAKEIFDNGVKREYSIPREELAAAIQKYNGTGELPMSQPKPVFPAKVEKEFIDFNDMFNTIEELVDRVDELSSRVDRIMKHLTRT
jgi:hypothetical protein